MTQAHEVNFDGLVGPTHNYAGLSPGNIASQSHKGEVSHPRAAALQGLAKMKRLMDLGVKQAVLPPHERPNIAWLRRVGFSGSDDQVIAATAREAPHLLAAACSASAMWTANAATVCPSADSLDGRVHFTPANLVTEAHRAIEAEFTSRLLRRVFADESVFAHHDPLPATMSLRDEGAANHMRLCQDYGDRGLHIFVYGEEPCRFPVRQTRLASEAVARLHGITQPIFVRQSPIAVEAGVFHYDVIAVGNLDRLLVHELAFVNSRQVLDQLQVAMPGLHVILVPIESLTLEEAVESYLFNSQLVRTPDGQHIIVCPDRCRENPRITAVMHEIVGDKKPFDAVEYVALDQSMRNGGGPACLRLRVVLNGAQLAAVHPGVILTDALYGRLCDWVQRYYRETLTPADLADPHLLRESRDALDELSGILDLGPIYRFQS